MRWSSRGIAAAIVVVSAYAAGVSDSANTFVHKKKYAMGTVFEIVAYDESLDKAGRAIDEAFAEIVRLDGLMNNYESESELSRLNRRAGYQAQAVSPDLYRVIQESLRYSEISGGKFDVTVGPVVDLWKAALQGGRAPSVEEDAKARGCVGYRKVELVGRDRIAFRSTCLHIDLGAIGKGYAVDRAAEVLRRDGIDAALIDAGGSTIYAMGAPPGQAAWLVHMRDPSKRIDPTIKLSNASVSTSEQSAASLLQETGAGHIVDPDTGMPLKTPFAVSVIAPTATASDALSTAALLAGPQAGKAVLEQMQGTAAIWIAANGESHKVTTGPEIMTEGQRQSRCRTAPEQNTEMLTQNCQ